MIHLNLNYRKFYFIILLSYTFLSLSKFNAQVENYKNLFQTRYGVGLTNGNPVHVWSLNLEFHTKYKIGLLYNLDYIYRTDNIKQVHASVGSLLGPPIFGLGLINAFTKDTIKDNDLDFGAGGIAIGILMILLPDGISYHVPLSYRIDYSPYINFLGIDHVRDRNIPKNYFKYAFSIGNKISYTVANRVNLGFFIEARGTASYSWTYLAGASLGILFSKRKEGN
ncbi:MAG: hypothetical protein HYU67_01275 [Flavobacteriia bacterium]|nr:hypothetical protein [Flavobacteriia bacterium]